MQAAYSGYQQRLGGQRLPPMDADYLSEINNYPTWVVESDGNIVGGLVMSFENNQAAIENIAVNPACQGQGIGRALIEFAEARASEQNHSELKLTTHALLAENIALYRHLGWEETGSNGTRVFMSKAV